VWVSSSRVRSVLRTGGCCSWPPSENLAKLPHPPPNFTRQRTQMAKPFWQNNASHTTVQPSYRCVPTARRSNGTIAPPGEQVTPKSGTKLPTSHQSNFTRRTALTIFGKQRLPHHRAAILPMRPECAPITRNCCTTGNQRTSLALALSFALVSSQKIQPPILFCISLRSESNPSNQQFRSEFARVVAVRVCLGITAIT
jgi:hypothetical protein